MANVVDGRPRDRGDGRQLSDRDQARLSRASRAPTFGPEAGLALRGPTLPRAKVEPMAPLTGRVHGRTIDLDAAPNPPLEGKRVRVVLELVDDDVRLTRDEQARAWSAWLASASDAPIADDGDPEFP